MYLFFENQQLIFGVLRGHCMYEHLQKQKTSKVHTPRCTIKLISGLNSESTKLTRHSLLFPKKDVVNAQERAQNVQQLSI
mmetsp:Transcript_24402/g.39174  ORF Transcript_24402/g.39174 Transcript_24402/m.39174 type:complete len:80 (-) Transcript_24402:1476-1715(-)